MIDPYNLDRFVQAQAVNYETALAEIKRGRKRSHWMWYVFPQFAGLGSSPMSQRYAITSLEECEAYLRHPLLGPRLRTCSEAVLAIEGRSASDIFGYPDDMKLKSSATLFGCVSPKGSVFDRIIEKYFDGQADAFTLRLVGPHSRPE